MKIFDTTKLNQAFQLLNEQLELRNFPLTEIVVCGGSALIASQLVSRTTQDVDIVAMLEEGKLVTAQPLPTYLITAAKRVGDILQLPEDWLNNGPASQFDMGLPEGFVHRLQRIRIGERLVIYYISRIDQIFFKTFASADRGGYHIADLKALAPTEEELYAAAIWCMEQDISEGFRFILAEMLKQNGWNNVCERL